MVQEVEPRQKNWELTGMRQLLQTHIGGNANGDMLVFNKFDLLIDQRLY